MYTDQLGNTIPSTIMGGVILLWHHKSYPIAAVIFIASVMVPVGKLFSVGYLLWSVRAGRTRSKQQRTTLYRISDGSPFFEGLNRTTLELNAALQSLQDLARRLEAQPSSLIFSSEAGPDPRPEARR